MSMIAAARVERFLAKMLSWSPFISINVGSPLPPLRLLAEIAFCILALAISVRALVGNRLGWVALRRDREAPPMSTIAAAVQTADRIDHWIRQQVIPYCHGTYPSQSMWNPAYNRRVGLLAIGQCLKDQYDALATPIPAHLAALLKQLETQETVGRSVRHRAA